MSNLSIFAFEGQQVRFVGTADKPEWIAQDVCDVLDVGLASNALRKFESDEKGMCFVHTPGGEQSMLSLTEPGLYRLAFKSRKPVAERFRHWIFHEVIPSIRKTGSYSLASAEIEQMKLELKLIRAKQHYQDTGHAIALSTSPAMLQWLRGEAPPPIQIEYRERFVDARGREIGSSSGRSLTQLITDAGLNPKSTRDRQLVKRILKSHGFNYDQMQRWVTASYLRSYPVLEEDDFNQALKVVLSEVTTNGQPNLFVHSQQQSTLTSGKQSRSLKEES